MKVKPTQNFQLIGTPIKLRSDTIYKAELAQNIPHWKERGAIFVNQMLLEKGEYEIIRPDCPKCNDDFNVNAFTEMGGGRMNSTWHCSECDHTWERIES